MKYCPRCASPLVLKVIDGAERKACSQADSNDSSKNCGFVDWNNPIPVAGALIEINGKYLLARNYAWPEGFFSLISGFKGRLDRLYWSLFIPSDESINHRFWSKGRR